MISLNINAFVSKFAISPTLHDISFSLLIVCRINIDVHAFQILILHFLYPARKCTVFEWVHFPVLLPDWLHSFTFHCHLLSQMSSRNKWFFSQHQEDAMWMWEGTCAVCSEKRIFSRICQNTHYSTNTQSTRLFLKGNLNELVSPLTTFLLTPSIFITICSVYKPMRISGWVLLQRS